MNATKKINVNFSSLVGLKAELLRKQTEVTEAKLRAEATRAVPKIKKKNKRPKESTVNQQAELTDVDDLNAHKKSKLMLEAKARLYDRLQKSKNKNENFLVDFANKPDESEPEMSKEEEENDMVYDNEDEWIEYQDCFGRTRKCLREDLPIMQEKDEFIKQQIMNRKNGESRHEDNIELKSIMEEKEPEIEIMRRKWEEQTEKLADKVNIHYQDILFDEARTHGVGYYAFSQDEEERTKQQENLANLRKDTERKQKEMKELKELRERMEQNRLKAARIRQRIRAGLPAEPTEEELAQNNTDTYNLNAVENTSDANTVEEKSVIENEREDDKKEDTTKDDIQSEDKELIKENKIKALGELLGKETTWREMSQEEWVDKCRKMRVNEFGPMYDNFKSGGYLNPANKDIQTVDCENNEKLESITKDTNSHLAFNKNETNPNDQNVTNNTNMQNVCQEKYLSAQLGAEQNLSSENVTVDHAYMYGPLPFIGSVPTYSAYSQIYPSYNAKTCASTPQADIENTEKVADTTQTLPANRNMNEENIVAGLRYLREKFEKGQNNTI